MLSNNEVEKILSLQNKAYDLFMWIKDSMKWGKLQFADRHVGMDPQDVMRKWIIRNQAAFPENVNIKEVGEVDMPAFLNMALSFPVVSFEPAKGGELIAGCDCGFCAVYSRNHFVVKKITAKDNERADRAVQLALQDLAEKKGLNLNSDQVLQFQKKHPELRRQGAIVAYLQDLDRRTRFEVQNSTGLALWKRIKKKREFVNSKLAGVRARRRANSPRFKLTVDDYSQAVDELTQKLQLFFAASAH